MAQLEPSEEQVQRVTSRWYVTPGGNQYCDECENAAENCKCWEEEED